MNIVPNPYNLSKYKNLYSSIIGLPRPVDITRVTIHGTGGGPDALWILKWIDDQIKGKNGNFKLYTKAIALFHFIIDNNGTVYQLIDTERYAFHSGVGGLDSNSIGIEIVNTDPSLGNLRPFTTAQYTALKDLLLFLLQKYTTINTITGHGAIGAEVNSIYKHCPGKHFNWTDIKSFLTSNGYGFQEKTVYSTVYQPRGKNTRIVRKDIHEGEYLYNIEGGTAGQNDVFKDYDLTYDDSGFELLANEDWRVKITPQGPQTPAQHEQINWIETFAPQIKLDDKKLLVDKINWVVPSGACTFPELPNHSGSIVTIPILPKATKTKGDDKLVMRKGDTGTCNCTFNSGGPATAASCIFEIDECGQTSCSGE